MLFLQKIRGLFASKEQKKIKRRSVPGIINREEPDDRYFLGRAGNFTPAYLAEVFQAAESGDMALQAELYDIMESRDAHLLGQLQIRKNAVCGLGYDIVGGRDSVRENVSEMIENIGYSVHPDFAGKPIVPSWQEILMDMMDALGKGYSLGEIEWDISEGQTNACTVWHVDCRKVTFLDSVFPKLITKEFQSGIQLPPRKFIYHRHKAKTGNDTSAGMMRTCSWLVLFKTFSIRDWVSFVEIFGKPIVLGKHDDGADDAEIRSLVSAVRYLGANAAGVISNSMEIELLSAAKSGNTGVHKELPIFVNAEISKLVNGMIHTANSGEGGIGTYGMGKADELVRAELTESDCLFLGATLTNQLIRPYVELNYGMSEEVPKFVFRFKKPENLLGIAELYEKLDGMGYPLSVEHLSDRFGVPIPEKGETILADIRGDSQQQAMKMMLLKQAIPGVDDLLPITLGSAVTGQKNMDRMVSDIVGELKKCKTFSDVRTAIRKKDYEWGGSPEFQEGFARAMLASSIQGYKKADEEAK